MENDLCGALNNLSRLLCDQYHDVKELLAQLAYEKNNNWKLRGDIDRLRGEIIKLKDGQK